MSDEQNTTGPGDEEVPLAARPRPRPAPPVKDADETQADETALPESKATESKALESKAPESATSRARRIGGRPVVPSAAPATAADAKRPSPPAPGPARHSAPPAAVQKEPKAPKAPKAPKVQREPRPGGQDSTALVGWIATGLLGAAAVVLLVLIAVAGHGVYYAKSGISQSTRNTNQQAALAAAKSCIATINTYDYRTLSKNEAAALACITGPFTNSMKLTYSKTLLPEAPVAKATQTAQINYAGITSVSPDGTQIQVLLYGQFTVTNLQTASSGTPRYDVFGVTATMDKVKGKWLVSKYVSDTGDSAGK